jgi:hypothetical protein
LHELTFKTAANMRDVAAELEAEVNQLKVESVVLD